MLQEPPSALRLITQAYTSLLIIGFALLPTQFIAYLYFQQAPALKFEDHLFHEFAIAVATLEGLFVTYVTWRCYQSSGEPLLRWLTLGFLAFVLIYTLHGAFTGMAHRNIWLFLLYGPASRLAMSILLFVGLLSYNRPSDGLEKRSDTRAWLTWIGLFLTMDLAVAYDGPSCRTGRLFTLCWAPGGPPVHGGRRIALQCAERRGLAHATDSLAAHACFRRFCRMVCAIVARIHFGRAVESYVVAGSRNLCWRIFFAQLWRRPGFPNNAIVRHHL